MMDLTAFEFNLSVRSKRCASVPDEDSRNDDETRATDERAILSQGKMREGFCTNVECGVKIPCDEQMMAD